MTTNPNSVQWLDVVIVFHELTAMDKELTTLASLDFEQVVATN